ncbi:hypothetical protein Suden_0927 [Sulfurimonas denitrificans DSM 1251]|uniref:Uncharacterized protein n=1 Tax=Sulfurimonas denitrificans (strain ATCC 33889 / DSM 1251) TaxID=326298 RepID=Q30S26_SULDN|nr:FecR domain-containing protein [Sulfurimonas denitrificans]ABB44205.1 hypothetical protein Suden_0927 [Sulfurimonas denitrificans DSM 1251]
MSFIFRIFILSLLFGYSLLFASIGSVSLLKGEASLEREGTVLGVKNGMNLEERDSIKTTKGSQIQLIFTDKTVITLGSESHFKVDEYLSEGSNPKAKFKFNQGTFKTITGRIGKSAPENFTLETKTATIGIRGTVIGGNVPQSSSAPDTIICLGGRITATSLQTGVTVNLPTGTVTVVPVSGPPSPPRQATPQDIAQFNESLGTPPPSNSPAESSNSPQDGGGSSAAQNGAPATQGDEGGFQSPAGNAPAAAPQTFSPTAAAAAQQTNQQNSTQGGVVENLSQGLGVPVGQIQQQIASNNPTPPTVVTPPPPVEPTPPPVVPTPPPVEPTPPPVIPTTPPVVTPPSNGSGGGYTPPPHPASYTTLFSNMSASNGASSTVLFPENVTKTMLFDATNRLWVSSDNAYIATTSVDGNFSYINSELANAQKMYIKSQDYENPVLFKSFPSDSGASGYVEGLSGLKPIASTWHELVTSAKGVMNQNFSDVIKYEENSHYDTRKWNYNTNLKIFNELYYIEDDWTSINSYAALYSDISNNDTIYQNSLSSALSDYMNGANFYIHGVPEANQNIKSYGTLQDGGKWYFIYNNVNSDFNNTVSVYGTLPITDAVAVSSDSNSVPFMQTTTDYPIYIVDRSGSKEMYSIKNFDSISNDMFNYVNNHFLEINTDYVTVDGSNITYTHLSPEYQQNVYLFYKIDDNGTLVEDARNGKMVNPITGNVLHVYTNYHTPTVDNGTMVVGDFAFGVIDNPLMNNEIFPTPTDVNNTISYGNGIFSNDLNMTTPAVGANYRKLAIEKALWSDKPVDAKVYVYSDYGTNLANRDFDELYNTGTFIKFPSSGNGIMMESYFDVLEEKSGSTVVKNYFTGSITTGRVVADGTDNKIVFKHFESLGGVTTSDSVDVTNHNFYLFNENAQFINADNGGLDNNKAGTEKYNWLAHEEVNAASSETLNVGLMKKVTDSSDVNLFKGVTDYNTSFATGAMKGFIIGADTSTTPNIWMGDITTFNINPIEGGELNITVAANNLGITTPISMADLSQTNSAEAIPSSSYLGEDMQAMIIESKTVNGKTYDFAMATLPDKVEATGKYSYQNDYTSWGYWVATEKAPTAGGSYAQGYWVAGYETPVSSIPTSTTYNYSGNILGTITHGTMASPILLDETNSFKAAIQFGATNPITITEMKFNTKDLGAVTGIGTATTPSNSIIDNTFSGTHTNGTTALDFKGKFFGPAAEAIGGAWSGTFNNAALSGTGVFKGVKE